MTTPSSRQIRIPEWNFSCTGCGDCCRRWHVAVSSSEKVRLQQLSWNDNDVIPPEITTTINTYEYLAHAPEGHCIYLEPETNQCKIHAKFGHAAKPIGCRVYPYNIATTFKDQYSVVGRFDCPAIRQNHGKPIAAAMPAIRRHIRDMGLNGGFDSFVLDGLEESHVKRIVRAFYDCLLSRNDLTADTKMIGAVLAVERLEKLGATFLCDLDDLEIFPSFFQRVALDCAHIKIRRLGLFERWRFLNLFISFMRRDEDIVGKGFASRCQRTAAIWQILFTTGNLIELGSEHPDADVDSMAVFDLPIENASEVDWSLYVELVKLRLQAFQFFGPANYDLSFYVGLSSLIFSFPLVIAAAKWSAIARDPQRCRVTPDDIDYAVGVIDHNLGRSALLGTAFFTTMIRQMTEVEVYARLVRRLIDAGGHRLPITTTT